MMKLALIFSFHNDCAIITGYLEHELKYIEKQKKTEMRWNCLEEKDESSAEKKLKTTERTRDGRG